MRRFYRPATDDYECALDCGHVQVVPVFVMNSGVRVDCKTCATLAASPAPVTAAAREEFWLDLGRPADAHLGAVGGE